MWTLCSGKTTAVLCKRGAFHFHASQSGRVLGISAERTRTLEFRSMSRLIDWEEASGIKLELLSNCLQQHVLGHKQLTTII